MTAFGVVGSWWALAAVPVAVLLGAVVCGADAWRTAPSIKSDNMFALLFRFAIIPMTLFAGRVLPGRRDAAGGALGRVRVAAVARRRAVPVRDGRRPQRVAARCARRLPAGSGPSAATRWLGGGSRATHGLAEGRHGHHAGRCPGWPPKAGPLGTLGRVGAVTARNLVAVRHSGYWLVVVSGFLEPVLYLLSIGVGVGGLVVTSPWPTAAW